MKRARFLGSSRQDVREFPEPVRIRAGHELFLVQVGREPDNWRPMPSIGAGVCEIRIQDASGIFRVIYVAKFREVIYVLHAFRKKTRKTATDDIELARRRFAEARALAQEG